MSSEAPASPTRLIGIVLTLLSTSLLSACGSLGGAVLLLPLTVLLPQKAAVYVPPNRDASPEENEELRAKALAGDQDAQKALYWGSRVDTASGKGVRIFYNSPEHPSYWLCRLAHDGAPEFQVRWGDYSEKMDKVTRQVWWKLAADSGNEHANELVRRVERKLAQKELAEVDRRVRNWTPHPELCPPKGP